VKDKTMSKLSRLAWVGAFLLGASSASIAATAPVLVRGTIQSVDHGTFVVRSYEGKTFHLAFNGETKFVSVVPAQLGDVQPGDFVGVGGTGSDTRPTALEVVIFPASMKGTGEGHYGWSVPAAVAAADRHQDTGTPAGAPPVQGTMTNATVASAAPASGAPPVQGTMTNATVQQAAPASGGTELTVTYAHGKTLQIDVPAGTPVVRLIPASQTILSAKAKLFTVAHQDGSGPLTAAMVAVGKGGLMPPM
jgi:hypothetical protein